MGFQCIVPLHHFRQVRSFLPPRDSTDIPEADVLDQALPGWRERTRELDARVDASRSRIEQARQDLEEAFEAVRPKYCPSGALAASRRSAACSALNAIAFAKVRWRHAPAPRRD